MKKNNKQIVEQIPTVTSLEEFSDYWESLRLEHLAHLFQLANEMQEEYEWVEQSVGRVFSQGAAQKFYNSNDWDVRLLEIIGACGICVEFDWKKWWAENSPYEKYNPAQLKALDPLTLCQIMTVFVRMELEQKGIILEKLHNKYFYAVIRALQHHLQNKSL